MKQIRSKSSQDIQIAKCIHVPKIIQRTRIVLRLGIVRRLRLLLVVVMVVVMMRRRRIAAVGPSRSTIVLGKISTTSIRHTGTTAVTTAVRIAAAVAADAAVAAVAGNVLPRLGGVPDLQTPLAPAHLDLVVDLPEGRGGVLGELVRDERAAAVGAVVPVADDGHVGEGSVAGEDGDEVGLVGRAGDLADEELDVGAAGFLLVVDGRVGVGVGIGSSRRGSSTALTDAVQDGTLLGRRHDGDGGGGVGLVHLRRSVGGGGGMGLVRGGADNDGRAVLLLGHLHDVAEGDAPRGAGAGSRGAGGPDDDPVRIRGDGIGPSCIGAGIGRGTTASSSTGSRRKGHCGSAV